MRILQINPRDNVAVALDDIKNGQDIHLGAERLIARQDIARGHKIAIRCIQDKEDVIKYGFPIGHATQTIEAGDLVHVHNLKTNLGDIIEYRYRPEKAAQSKLARSATFQGYRRQDGSVGVRNEIWIIPTVGCVNRNAQIIARQAAKLANGSVDGIYEFTHPYGCSQLGEDQLLTQKILAGLVNHPNAGGVLVLGLGCENNNIAEFKKILGPYDSNRVKFLVAQDVDDEIEAGVNLVAELIEHAKESERETCPVSDLVVGLKCGGSDGFSGITANPLVGVFSDLLIASGGSTVMTEVPEMFGAELLLMNRATDEAVFAKTVSLINDFKQYFMTYNQPVYENPSPGNKAGGISTLEEKSLGCTQKGGESAVVDVLAYGEQACAKGLNLLNGPGNDMVASTVLAAAGCQVILFTTGRGTPLGTAVPTVKIATNSALYHRKANWMDFDAGRLLSGVPMAELADELLEFVSQVASGAETKAEALGFREIALFKNGVTL